MKGYDPSLMKRALGLFSDELVYDRSSGTFSGRHPTFFFSLKKIFRFIVLLSSLLLLLEKGQSNTALVGRLSAQLQNRNSATAASDVRKINGVFSPPVTSRVTRNNSFFFRHEV